MLPQAFPLATEQLACSAKGAPIDEKSANIIIQNYDQQGIVQELVRKCYSERGCLALQVVRSVPLARYLHTSSLDVTHVP